MKKKFLKKPKLPKLRRVAPEAKLDEAIESLPRITNETVAEHREEMLSSARKYIYPLTHTKRRVVFVSASLLITVVVLFFAYVTLALYKFQATSSFLYGVTRILPLPVARAGDSFVSYESYLFELRHYMHYYETQQQVDFGSESGKEQLQIFRKQALQQVIDDAYVKQLAKKHQVSVSNAEVNDAVTLLREQNRLGSSDQEFADVLKEFWGWSVDDFRRELRQQLLAQKVVAKLDTATNDRANEALGKAQGGGKFGSLAKQYSDDPSTKGNGGEYAVLIDRNNRDIAPQVVDTLFKLRSGQVSDLVNTGYSLEILKVISKNNNKVRAAHIMFNYKNVDTYLKPLREASQPQRYIKVD